MTLLKKAMRAMWRAKKTYIACILLIMLGVMLLFAFGVSGDALQSAKTRYYTQRNMADVFAKVTAVSKAQAESLRIEGVSSVTARTVVDVPVEFPDTDKTVKLRLISESSTGNEICRIDTEKGNLSAENDLLISQGFLDAWNLEMGDSVTLIIAGRQVEFNIAGTFLSPEYVYIVDEAGSMMPDESTFSVAIAQESALQTVLGTPGVCNDLIFKLDSNVTFDDAKVALEDALRKFGLISLTPLKDQLSNTMLTSEIDGVTTMSSSVPMVFIFMSIVILYLMLKRIIEQDRSQIGTMKAFGYNNAQILGHYITYGFITGLLGGIFGVLTGFIVSGSFINLYGEFYKMPNLVRVGMEKYAVIGLVISTLGGVAGSIMGAWRTMKMSPAESMRPEAPKETKHRHGRNPLADKLLSTQGHMAMRSISRNKVRSVFVVGGMIFSLAILTFMGSYSSMIDDMMLVQYSRIQTYDAKITLKTPIKNTTDIERVEGVESAEGIFEYPAEVKAGHRSKTAVITGIAQDGVLYNIYDVEKKITYPPPTDGIILTQSLAKDLETSVGDYVEINDKQIRVTGIVSQSMGMGAYIDKNFLCDITDNSNLITSVLVRASDLTELTKLAKNNANIRSLTDQAGTAKQLREMMEPYTKLTFIFLIVGIVVAFAIAYNTASIALMERKREYSTLRVLGLHIREVAGILGFEYWLLGSLGIILGIPLAKLLKVGMAASIDIEQFAMPTNVTLQSYIIGIVCTCIAIFWSNHSSIRQVRKMDMVEVLKERE